ncbi:methylmalonyl-CoA mutase family protein [Thalassovita sp.]|uniref:methylmalonyl-CoA mutase family protein n=1 Tax=Thalassovita sp. TaxID=1979401 RepID=UPI0029DE831A|nr:methylmalonyl-CoA mutase family protein [Thalassovita sp.]
MTDASQNPAQTPASGGDLATWLRQLSPDTGAADPGGRPCGSSQLPLQDFYGPEGAEKPGHFPFSRGVSARGYLDEHWVIGMYSGYASPRETNARFKALLATGQTGLSIALDLPTQVGIDSDDPQSLGEVGKVGVPINSVDDMLALLDGLPIDQVRQMRSTANAIAPMFLAIVIVALEELGIDPASFRLFLQNDPLKEFPARGTWIFPPAASLKMAVDVVEYIAINHKGWQPQQYCGYHIRDAGGTAVEEVAVATANGLAYLEEAKRRGIDIATLAPTMFLFLAAGVDIFEEAAKFRAARRIWARLLNERYGVPKSACNINIFAYTLGGALQAREPFNNVARISYEALAAVLGGVQTLATSSWDEAHSLPSQEAANLSVRTQQILAHESGVANVVDPLGGSWYVEDLTTRLEAEILRQVATIVDHGGAVRAIENGYVEDMLAQSAYREFRDIQSGKKPIVGVNFKPREVEAEWNAEFVLPPGILDEVMTALSETRKSREEAAVRATLDHLKVAAREGENLIASLIDAARARATMGEMTDTLAEVFGRHGGSAMTVAARADTSRTGDAK